MTVVTVLDQLRHNSLDNVDRNRKANTFVTATLRENGAVDTDHQAIRVEQRAS